MLNFKSPLYWYHHFPITACFIHILLSTLYLPITCKTTVELVWEIKRIGFWISIHEFQLYRISGKKMVYTSLVAGPYPLTKHLPTDKTPTHWQNTYPLTKHLPTDKTPTPTDKTPTDYSLNSCYPCLFGSQIWSSHFKFFLCLTTSDCESVLVAAFVRKAGDCRLIVENQLSLFLTITARHVVEKSIWF